MACNGRSAGRDRLFAGWSEFSNLEGSGWPRRRIAYTCLKKSLAQKLLHPESRIMNSASDYTHLTVLVVDDDDFSLELMRGILEDLGVHQVTLASSAKAAIDALQCQPKSPDLLVCDLYMPDMDGFDFMNALVDRNYSGSLVLCSGVSIDNLILARDFGRGMGLKLLGAYQKPISISEFQRILESLTG